MRHSTFVFPIFVLALLALLTFWVDFSVHAPTGRSDANKRHDPDYFITNFENMVTDNQGALRYKLFAEKMNHYPDDDSTDLVKPDFTQYKLGKKHMHLISDTGEVSKNGDDVKLYNNVLVTRMPFGDKGKMTLETDYLNILTKEDLILTQRPVVIKEAPKTVVYATGMVYDKKTNKLTLLNKVRAHYEKPLKKGKIAKKINTLVDQTPNNMEKNIGQLQNKANQPSNQPNRSKLESTTTTESTRIRRRYD